MPEFICDLSQEGSPLRHVWAHTVGSGHALLGLRADWQAQLRRCHAELGVQHVRFHGLLDDDMGTLTRQQDQLVYSFFNADQIMDFLVSIGMRPFVELGFMPTALASGETTVFHYRGNVTPPKDYGAWETLVHRLVAHWAERYGLNELRRWLFEVWNEPNQDAFWTGSQADYFELYRHTARAIKRVDERLQVGGPATAQNQWIGAFIDFCDGAQLPVDFVSTHQYPTDAFGQPGDDTERQLAASQRGILQQRAQDVRREAGGKPVYYTEWSTSSNPFFHRHDEPFAAAFALKSWLDAADIVEGYSYWTFSDLFEENYFSWVPFHGGFGLLTIHGIAKPAYRVAQLLRRLGDQQWLVDGLHDTVNCWVTRHDASIRIVLANHALPGHPIEHESVVLTLRHADPPRKSWLERIDETHANPRRVWEHAMGQADYLDAEQVAALQAASALVPEPLAWRMEGRNLVCELTIPPHAVAAVSID